MCVPVTVCVCVCMYSWGVCATLITCMWFFICVMCMHSSSAVLTLTGPFPLINDPPPPRPPGGSPPEAGVWFPRLPMGSHLGQLPAHHGRDPGHVWHRAVSLQIPHICECTHRWWRFELPCRNWRWWCLFGSMQCGWSSGWVGTHSLSASTWRWETCHRWAPPLKMWVTVLRCLSLKMTRRLVNLLSYYFECFPYVNLLKGPYYTLYQIYTVEQPCAVI